MAVTLNNIKFYHPPSLPARPIKSTSPNDHHTSKRTDSTPSTHSKLSFSPFSQPALPHPLPPRPPAIIPCSHHTASATLHFPSSTSHTADSHPVCKNDFHRALDDFFSAKNGKNDEDGESSIRVPTQDHGNDNRAHATSPNLEVLSQMTASLPSPSFSHPRIHRQHSAHLNRLHQRPISSTLIRQISAQGSSIVNRERSETTHASGVLSHSPKSGGSTLRNESTDLQGASGDSKRASSCQLEESSNRKRSPSARLSPLSTPQVVVPVLSRRSVSLRRKSNYLDNPEREDAGESLRPSKRRRRILDEASSTSRVPRQLSSESPRAKRPESPPEDLSAESEPIPVQGFLRLRSSGSEVIYCLELSQTHFSSSVAGGQIESPRPHQRTARPATRIRFTPEEDAFIVQLKAQELS
ncbi:hypothetical protein TSTA_038340 [Talaromyces stipitatus ATCC 10500]|uniref:Uncharacterized protein n=1 Tax=Talaromyces stipitatus (strain ATCC 10500 / CBS 375.48 / QM 6759 / NRRL 1006) TaxID=441959 RepID=B8M8W4_TALSN|nr:uncharacterized protein TSTA_038340 [Talaromyces stipitatus ATCC 10500]EED20627.1 hypothetical protein TSTA_038340 [Talaromyces stipitatus ATCC 10500]